MFASVTCAVTIPKRKRSNSCARNQSATALNLQKDSVKKQRVHQKDWARAVSSIASRADWLPSQPYGLAADNAATRGATGKESNSPELTDHADLSKYAITNDADECSTEKQ